MRERIRGGQKVLKKIEERKFEKQGNTHSHVRICLIKWKTTYTNKQNSHSESFLLLCYFSRTAVFGFISGTWDMQVHILGHPSSVLSQSR